MRRRRLNVRQQKSAVSKRLQTELQSLIAYSCYDSADVLQCGTAAKKQTQVDKLYHRFMPSNKADDDHVSNVEQFLEGIGVFSFLFERHDAPEIDESTRDPNLPLLHLNWLFLNRYTVWMGRKFVLGMMVLPNR